MIYVNIGHIVFFIVICMASIFLSNHILNRLMNIYPNYRDIDKKAIYLTVIISILSSIIIQFKVWRALRPIILESNKGLFLLATIMIFAVAIIVLSSSMSVSAIIDSYFKELPDENNFLIGISLFIISMAFKEKTLITGLLIFILFLIPALTSSKFGMGDAKLGLALGLGLAISKMVKYIYITCAMFFAYYIVMSILKRGQISREMAFGPFMIVGFLIIF